MDIFKGIGDFFGGLFGQKKKRKDEQQQPQQQSAVSFNNAPKLGDNFINNLNNLTQPQRPKEFAKSSVDLNPVKPVQPQPQMNRDQERQQLANKYRQEETDRYNQGLDHAANFLNDIFSGGKTAQMRENTINQNIQNRVNAEMLRKYGPDDQQVKQNIAQTSQDINNKAASVNDFTKNYNNTVQQTVTSPVSAVKGAAISVVETVPKVSGAGGLDLFTNNYKNIDTSLLHPNCTCIERFKVLEIKQEVQELKKEDYKKYFKDYTSDWQLEKKSSLRDEEKKIIDIVNKEFNFKEIITIRRVEYPQKIKTPDLIINGDKVDIKGVSSENAVRKQISKSLRQIDDGWIIFDISNYKDSEKNIIGTILKRTKQKNIKKFIIADRNKVVYIKNIK